MVQAVLFNDLSRQTQTLARELGGAAERVIFSGWYVLGSENEKFEQDFAAYCGARHAVGVANGTDALELALKAVGVAPGQSVATVANAGGYATGAIRAIGAHPAFVDVLPETQLVDLAHLEQIIASQPLAAVVATHLFGRMVNMTRLVAICSPRSIPIVEDCAQAHGAVLERGMAGSIGAAGSFSFYPTKNLGALGDGGAIITNDPAIAERARSLRQYGWNGKYHVAASAGRNSRLDELQAAFLRAKLPFLQGWNERRRSIADHYRSAITNPKVQCPPESGADYVAHLFVIRCEDRTSLRAHLQSAQIGCDIHYPVPDHRQAGWIGPSTQCVTLPVTERLASQVISLPCYAELRDEEVDAVIRAVNGW